MSMIDERILGGNTLPNNSGSTWVRPKSLTPEEVQLLDSVNFPKEVKHPNVLQKRVTQEPLGDVYIASPNGDVVYLVTSYEAARVQQPRPPQGRLKDEEYKDLLRKKVTEYQKNRIVAFYFSRNHIQAEMKSFLDSKTAPTVPTVAKTTVPTVKGLSPTHKAKVKGLSPTHKAKVKDLLGNSYTSQEIAEEIGKPVEMINDYINKLSKNSSDDE